MAQVGQCMMLVHSAFRNAKSFTLIPVSLDSPYVEAMFDPSSGILAVISKVMKQYCGGLQASLGYCGSKDIPSLQKNGKLIRVSSAGAVEAHAHDVKITKEAPNYRR